MANLLQLTYSQDGVRVPAVFDNSANGLLRTSHKAVNTVLKYIVDTKAPSTQLFNITDERILKYYTNYSAYIHKDLNAFPGAQAIIIGDSDTYGYALKFLHEGTELYHDVTIDFATNIYSFTIQYGRDNWFYAFTDFSDLFLGLEEIELFFTSDILNGGNLNDKIHGYSGNDKLNGYDGNDFLDGGEGDDQISGGNGNDVMNGGSGENILQGGSGNDTFEASAGINVIYGGNLGVANNDSNQIDKVVFTSSSSNYSISKNTNSIFGHFYYIKDNRTGSPDGLNTLFDIDQLQFTDGIQSIAPVLYTLTPSVLTINEGSTLTTTVSTNEASGTTLYYSLSGTGITSTDFSSGALTGLGSVASNGSFSFSHTLANDLATEGTETLNIKLFSDTSRSIQVGSTASVSIVDTSKSDGKTYAIRTFSDGQWVDTFSEGDWIGVQVNTTNVLDGTVLYFSLSGIGINAGDFVQLGAVELLPVGNVQKGVSQFYRQLANDLKTEGIETLHIKLFSDSLRTIEVGSKEVPIVDTNIGLTYYNPSTNNTLNTWTAYQVTNSVKAGDIVSQWFGTAPPATQQIQDISDTKLMDVVATTWADKVKINRVIKASDTGGKIEAKQIDFSTGEVAGSVISGGEGNDDIKGFAGWDIIDGGAGDDLIHGGNGRDILTGGVGRDELHGDFGWNTYRSEKDGVSDLIAIKSDQFLVNWLYGKAGNSPNGEKSDIIEGLDSIDKIKIIGVDTSEITFAANVSAKGVTGIGVYGKGILEALYTGGDLTLAQITQMTSGDASAAAMSNSVNAYGVW